MPSSEDVHVLRARLGALLSSEKVKCIGRQLLASASEVCSSLPAPCVYVTSLNSFPIRVIAFPSSASCPPRFLQSSGSVKGQQMGCFALASLKRGSDGV